jgi:polar amino acid transport system substrate-binding protein
MLATGMNVRAVAVSLGILLCGNGIGRSFPCDAQETLKRVQGGRIRVGVVENAPWAQKIGDEARGIEAALVRELAEELGAKPEWHWGGEQAHMEALGRFELDLVIGGLTNRTPWKKKVGLSMRYFEQHVLVTPPGENAWIKRLDEFLSSRQEAIRALLRADEAKP